MRSECWDRIGDRSSHTTYLNLAKSTVPNQTRKLTNKRKRWVIFEGSRPGRYHESMERSQYARCCCRHIFHRCSSLTTLAFSSRISWQQTPELFSLFCKNTWKIFLPYSIASYWQNSNVHQEWKRYNTQCCLAVTYVAVRPGLRSAPCRLPGARRAIYRVAQKTFHWTKFLDNRWRFFTKISGDKWEKFSMVFENFTEVISSVQKLGLQLLQYSVPY